MFLGSHAINMDAKGRMAIPTKIRESLSSFCGGRVVVTAHTEERCLLVYPETKWLEILPSIEKLPTRNKAARRFQRLLIGYATPLEMDGNGRILLSSTLRDYAGLEKKTMLVGQGSKFELWNEDSWFACLDDSDVGDDIPDELKNLSF